MIGNAPAPDDTTSLQGRVPWESVDAPQDSAPAGSAPPLVGPASDVPDLLPMTEAAALTPAPPATALSNSALSPSPDTPEEDRGEGPSGALPDDFDAEIEPQTTVPSRGGWTLPVLCAGIALIACCVLIPQADANRRFAYERAMLQSDLESIQKQVQVNEQFLKKVADDPELAERLAQRQMKIIREGTRVLDLRHDVAPTMSPFQLVTVASPPPLPPYQPVGGALAAVCREPRSRLYLSGGALILIATGLVLGYAPTRS